jgi:hypothetical protein
MAGNEWDELREWSRQQRNKGKPGFEGTSSGNNPRSGDETAASKSATPHNIDDKNAKGESAPPRPEDRRPDLPEPIATFDALKDPRSAAGSLARDTFASKTGIKLPAGLSQDLRTPGRRGAAVKAGLEAGVTAGLVYLGVPPNIAGRISGKVLAVTASAMTFVLLLMVGLVAGIGFSGNRDPIAENSVYLEIDKDMRAAAARYASIYRVPSRALLGIAGAQTNYGRYSPYDDFDRAPSRPGIALPDKIAPEGQTVSAFPSSRPAIGSSKIEGQGLGMFLVQPGAAARARIDAQDADRTMRWLAELMREEANTLVKEGAIEPNPRSADYTGSDDFWGKVVASLPLVDPLSDTLRCAAPSDVTDVSIIISMIWNCEVDRRADVALPSVQGSDQLYVSYSTGRSISNQLVREALTVAWSWGKAQNPEVQSWVQLSARVCNPDAQLTGVYPLTRETAKIIGVKNRCDVSEVASAVARSVLDRLRQPESPPSVDVERPYSVEQDAWSILPWTLGNESARLAFANEGPTKPFYPNDSCEKLIVGHLTSISLNPQIRDYYVRRANEPAQSTSDLPGFPQARELLTGPSAGNPRDDVRCRGRLSKIGDAAWMETIATESSRLVTLLSEGTRVYGGVVPPEITALSGMALLARDLLATYPDALRAAIPGSDPSVERLSADLIYVDMPPAGEVGTTVSFGLWQRILTEALRVGGLLPDDPRAGSTFQFTAGGGIGIALTREEPASKPILPTEDGTVSLPPCGDPNNAREHRAVTAYVNRWIAMCNAAASAGVELSIVSSWRSMAEQTYLYNKYGPDRAAAPGKSNHQRGWALDISMNEGLSYSNHPAYAYLHSIVGCLTESTKQYSQLGASVTPEQYVAALKNSKEPCGAGAVPIKRVQTYGLVPLCTFRLGEDYDSPGSLLCSREQTIPGTSGQIREPWHLDYGIVVVPLGAQPASCNTLVPIDPTNKQSVAIAIKTIFYCELSSAGLTAVAPIEGPNYPAGKYFSNLAEQVSSEAVLVAFCESGLDVTAGEGGRYVGLFQMGIDEINAYGGQGAPRTDARTNVTAAARYWLAGWKTSKWGGWGPWAVVNTDFWETNRAVLRPAVGRFPSTHPSAEGKFGPDLPLWAVDPSKHWGPVGGCGEYAYAGKTWPLPPVSKK